MSDRLAIETLQGFLKLDAKEQFLYHREGQELEFKESYNHNSLVDYARDFAAFANNRGGYLIFGVKDSPRIPQGLSLKALEQFQNIQIEKVTQTLNEFFSPAIRWDSRVFVCKKKDFAVFYIYESDCKPVMALKEGEKIKSSDIFYRYGGRTQKILPGELHQLIAERIDKEKSAWQRMLSQIAAKGSTNIALLDTVTGVVDYDKKQVALIDKQLLSQISFIREGQFDEKAGAPAIKIIGEAHPIDSPTIYKAEEKHLLDQYQLTYTELEQSIREQFPSIKQRDIQNVIREHGIKQDKRYSYFVFRNATQKQDYEETKEIPVGVPSVYNSSAKEYIVQIWKQGKK
jgi:Putative DNA-binding domain